MAECPDERETTVQGILDEMAIKAEQKLGIQRGPLGSWRDEWIHILYICISYYMYMYVYYIPALYIYTHAPSLSLFLRNTLYTHIIICINKHILYT